MHVNKVLQKLREGKPVLVGTGWTGPPWQSGEMMGMAGHAWGCGERPRA